MCASSVILVIVIGGVAKEMKKFAMCFLFFWGDATDLARSSERK